MLCCCASRRRAAPEVHEKKAAVGDELGGPDVRPLHYDLCIQADLDTMQYRGRIDALVHVKHAARRLTLHADPALCIGAARVNGEPASTELDAARMSVTLTTHHSPLAPGRGPGPVHIELSFARAIDSSLMGFFHATRSRAAYTQFSPIAARRAFPCWDEPRMKATFAVSIVHDAALEARGNMPGRTRGVSHADIDRLLRTDTLPAPAPALLPRRRWACTQFAPTPLMPTYLVAWALGTFEHAHGAFASSSLRGRTVPLTLLAPHGVAGAAGAAGVAGAASAALELEARMLPLLEHMCGLAYPLPKLDTLAVDDFGPTAMENWGLIIGRASAFLTSPDTSLEAHMAGMCTLAHELAHMWFGNMVTMPAWESVWLKEALATLVGEVIALAHIKPAWDCRTTCIGTHVHRALALDARRASHPLEIALAGAPAGAIGQVFDAISYSKGASVLRMLEALIGHDAFVHGLRLYLARHTYATARTCDLWAAMRDASHVDVPAFMHSWVHRPGFPVLIVQHAGAGRFTVTQRRFLATGDATREEDETIWHIPLAMRPAAREAGGSGAQEQQQQQILTTRTTTITPPQRLWKLNADTIGVYRVAYPATHLLALGAAHAALSDADRVGLVDDAFALAQAGYSSIASALSLANLLKGTPSAAVACALDTALASVASTWWDAPDVRVAVGRFRVTVFAPEAHRLTLKYAPGEPHGTRTLRTAVVRAAARAGDALTLGCLAAQFSALVSGSPVHPDLLEPVLEHGVRCGGQAAYDFVRTLYTSGKAQTPSLRALCAASRGRMLEQTAALLVDGYVGATDYVTFFSALGANPDGRQLGWHLLSTHYDTLVARGASNFVLPRMVAAAVAPLATAADEHAVRAFFAARTTSAFADSLAQALEEVRARVQWRAHAEGDLRKWLIQYGYLS